MKKKICRMLTAMLLLVLALSAGVAAAAEPLASRTLYPTSFYREGEERALKGDYLILNEDNTGMVVVRGAAYSLEWRIDADGFVHFEDSKGYSFDGIADEDGAMQGGYRRSICSYEPGDDAPIISFSPDNWGRGLPQVNDQAGLLTDGEAAELTARAQELSQRYGCNIYIVTMDDMDRFTLSGSIFTCAEELRTGYQLGQGTEKDCVLLALSIAGRDIDLVVNGPSASYAFSQYAREQLQDLYLSDFAGGDWKAGFDHYLSGCETLLERAAQGDPVQEGDRLTPPDPLLSLGCSAGIAFLISLIVCLILKGSMKTTAQQTEAAGYVPKGGVKITDRRDQYTHTTETRVYDPPQKSSDSKGGGGGGSFTSASGHSHTGGKF